MYRLGVVLIAVAAGAATGALVFKVVGEERLGGELKVFAARFGFRDRPGGVDALSVIESIAPGTKEGFKNAAIGTVAASLLAATAVTIAVREIAG